jgi:hypothetical protein
MSGNGLYAGSATTGPSGGNGPAITGDSNGGDGGTATAVGGSGGAGGADYDFLGITVGDGSGTFTMNGGTSTANGANASSSGTASSTGAASGNASGGDINTPLNSYAGTGADTAGVDQDPYSGYASSGTAQNNAPIISSDAFGGVANYNTVAPYSLSEGGLADGGDSYAQSLGGNSLSLNESEANSLAYVYGYADGGVGGYGGHSSVDLVQTIDPILITPVLDMPYHQDNTSVIVDGNEFQPAA